MCQLLGMHRNVWACHNKIAVLMDKGTKPPGIGETAATNSSKARASSAAHQFYSLAS